MVPNHQSCQLKEKNKFQDMHQLLKEFKQKNNQTDRYPLKKGKKAEKPLYVDGII